MALKSPGLLIPGLLFSWYCLKLNINADSGSGNIYGRRARAAVYYGWRCTITWWRRRHPAIVARPVVAIVAAVSVVVIAVDVVISAAIVMSAVIVSVISAGIPVIVIAAVAVVVVVAVSVVVVSVAMAVVSILCTGKLSDEEHQGVEAEEEFRFHKNAFKRVSKLFCPALFCRRSNRDKV